MKTIGNWGLVVPGRPPTPSEGHAQSYARIGPEASQRLIAFDNGTCLSFGPDDVVDEFLLGKHPFTNQIALIDKAIRDCKSVSTRYLTTEAFHDGNNSAYHNFRSQLLPDHTTLQKVTLESGTYVQVPSKLASVGTLISIHANPNKSDVPGASHPGFSVDTRFGTKRSHEILQQRIDRQNELDWESDDRQEEGMHTVQQNGLARGRRTHGSEAQQAAQVIQRHQRHPHNVRRGRRQARSRSLANRVQLHDQLCGRSQSVGQPVNLQSQQVYQQNQVSQPPRVKTAAQADVHHNNSHCIEQFQKNQFVQAVAESWNSLAHAQNYSRYNVQYQPIITEHGLLSQVDSNGIPYDKYPEVIAEHIVRDAIMSGNADRFKPDVLARFAPDLVARLSAGLPAGIQAGLPGGISAGHHIRPEVYRMQHKPDQNFGSQHYVNQTNPSYNFSNQTSTSGKQNENVSDFAIQANIQQHRSTQQVHHARNLNVQFQDPQLGGSRSQAYTAYHGRTARRADHEYAIYLDELNQGGPNRTTQRLDGDAFAGEPVLTVRGPTPNVLAAIAIRNGVQPQILLQPNQSQSVTSTLGHPYSPHPRRNSRAHFLHGTDDPRIPASGRPPTRTVSSQAATLSPPVSGTTIFGELPGNVTREHSQETRRRRLFAPFLDSRRSSPGREALRVEGGQERPASAGYQI